MILYLVRHGETDWNKEGRMQGGADIPLNDYGLELARITSEKMREIPVEAIYSSPLIRAYRTAEILRRDRRIGITPDKRLAEISFGRYEGTLMRDAVAQADNPLHDFLCAPERYRARDGENFADVIARAQSFIDEVLSDAARRYQTVLVTAHGAFIRCFLRCIEERPLSEFWNGIPQKNCAVTTLELSDGVWKVLSEGELYYF